MSELLQAAVGVALMLAAWLIPRHIAKARMAGLPAVLLDLSPVLLAAGLLLTATGRPIFTGLALVSLGGGFALADRTKRDALREPVVFSDISELPHVFTHPQLYLPFAGAGLVIGGALATIAFGITLLSVEPPLWPKASSPPGTESAPNPCRISPNPAGPRKSGSRISSRVWALSTPGPPPGPLASYIPSTRLPPAVVT